MVAVSELTLTSELKPCPFCGSYNLRNWGSYVRCEDCLADGPFMQPGSDDDAAAAWNKRNIDPEVLLDVAREIENYGDPLHQWLAEVLREEVL